MATSAADRPRRKKTGRPTTYTPEVGQRICARIAETAGGFNAALRNDKHLPSMSTLFQWLGKHEEFAEQYARAMQIRAHRLADQIVSLSDEAKVAVAEMAKDKDQVKGATALAQSYKLAVDARKWVVSKLLPRQYGESQHIEVSGEVVQKRIILVRQDGARTELPVGEGRENCRALPSLNGVGDSVNAKASSARR